MKFPVRSPVPPDLPGPITLDNQVPIGAEWDATALLQILAGIAQEVICAGDAWLLPRHQLPGCR